MSTTNHNNSNKTQNPITAYFARYLHEPLDYLFAKDYITGKEYSAGKRLRYLHHLQSHNLKAKLGTVRSPERILDEKWHIEKAQTYAISVSILQEQGMLELITDIAINDKMPKSLLISRLRDRTLIINNIKTALHELAEQYYGNRYTVH